MNKSHNIVVGLIGAVCCLLLLAFGFVLGAELGVPGEDGGKAPEPKTVEVTHTTHNETTVREKPEYHKKTVNNHIHEPTVYKTEPAPPPVLPPTGGTGSEVDKPHG